MCSFIFITKKLFGTYFNFFDYLILIFQEEEEIEEIEEIKRSFFFYSFLTRFSARLRVFLLTILHPRILGINSPVIAKSREKVRIIRSISTVTSIEALLKWNEISGTRNCTFRFVSTHLCFSKIDIFDRTTEESIDQKMLKNLCHRKLIFQLYNVKI